MISVCLATYNGERFIKRQLDSIILQLGESDEIIISDNNSNDNTLEIVERYNDTRIRIYHNNFKSTNKYLNIVNNFNNAISYARGDYIFLADQDDIWLKGKVEILKKDLLDYGCVISNYNIIDENDRIVFEKKFDRNPLNSFFYAMIKFPFLGCSMAFKKSFFDSFCYPFPSKLILHDIWIGLNAFCRNQLFYDNHILISYRMHDKNVTTASKGKSRNSFLFKIKYRLYIYYSLIKQMNLKR